MLAVTCPPAADIRTLYCRKFVEVALQLTTLDPSLAAQATAAGISTVKNLLSKKVKLVKVMVKAGYKILLKDKSLQQ